MTSRLSIYTKPTHSNAWLDYARQLHPYDILILDADIQQVSDAHKASPDSEITIRRWDWDDGSSPTGAGIWNEFENHPEELADWTVEQYGKLLTEWEKEAKDRGIVWPDRAQLTVHLANEPNTNNLMGQINRYTVRAVERAKGLGFHLDALNFGTGHPATLNANHEPDWSPVMESLQALAANGHYAVTHEYYNTTGIRDVSVNPWHVNRHHFAPHIPGLRWKIGEFGLEQLVNGLEKEHQGYIDRISNEQYLSDIDYALQNLRDDEVAERIFMTDFVDRAWRTFNTVPIHPQLIVLGQKYPSAKPIDTPPIVINLPAVGTGQPMQNQDDFQRARAFVRKWEGGWADNPADPGGATNKGITIGTFTRWRQTHGQGTPTKDDLRNLSDAEADEIYRVWYWLASGADKLAWPLNLAQFDTAVNAGPGRADDMLALSGGNFDAYMGHLLTWYAGIPNFETFGRAWTSRRADLLLEAAKP